MERRLRCRDDDLIGAKGSEKIPLLWVRGDGDHAASTEVLGDLDGVSPNTATGAGDQDRVALLHPADRPYGAESNGSGAEQEAPLLGGDLIGERKERSKVEDAVCCWRRSTSGTVDRERCG